MNAGGGGLGVDLLAVGLDAGEVNWPKRPAIGARRQPSIAAEVEEVGTLAGVAVILGPRMKHLLLGHFSINRSGSILNRVYRAILKP
jgi:hypothetical protein